MKNMLQITATIVFRFLSLDGRFSRTFGTSGSGDGNLNNPISISCHSTGVYVAENGNNRISVFSEDGRFLRKFASHGSSDGQVNGPWGIFAEDTELFVAEYGNNRISVFDLTTGTFKRKFASSGTGPGNLSNPEDVVVDGDNVIVADYTNNRISIFDRAGTFIKAIGSNGSTDGQFVGPLGVTVMDGVLYVSEYSAPMRIQAFE